MFSRKSFFNAAVLASALAALVGGSGLASASVVTYETRNATSVPTFTDSASYVSYYNSLTPATAVNVSTWANLSSKIAPFASLTTVDFWVTSTTAGTWKINVGPDFGSGGTVVLDGVAVATNTHDMWWGGDFNSSTQAFQLSETLGAGKHELKVYGVEGCCNGGTSAEFLAPGSSSYTVFSAADGAVPEPAMWIMLIVGFGLVGTAMRYRNDVKAFAAI